MKTQICTTCDDEKPLDCFYSYIRDGEVYYTPRCKQCRHDYDHARKAETKPPEVAYVPWPGTGKDKPVITGLFGDWIKSSLTPREARL